MHLLDQSSVLFKSAAGKRSMLFHRARTVAAIKTEAAEHSAASITNLDLNLEPIR